MPNYTVKGIKKFRGMEGYGFNADLYRDGKKVALVMDEATGGGLRFEWKQNDRIEEALLIAHCATLPNVTYFNTSMKMSPDLFVDELVNDVEVERAFARVIKKTTFVINNTIRYMTRPRETRDDAIVMAKHPGAVILNNLPHAEAFALFKKHTSSNG